MLQLLTDEHGAEEGWNHEPEQQSFVSRSDQPQNGERQPLVQLTPLHADRNHDATVKEERHILKINIYRILPCKRYL